MGNKEKINNRNKKSRKNLGPSPGPWALGRVPGPGPGAHVSNERLGFKKYVSKNTVLGETVFRIIQSHYSK